MIPNARQILDASTPHKHNGMFLKVMPHAGNVCSYLNAIGQANPSNLPEGRVGFLGGGRVDARAHSPFLRTLFEGRRGRFFRYALATFSDQLIYGRHTIFPQCEEVLPCESQRQGGDPQNF